MKSRSLKYIFILLILSVLASVRSLPAPAQTKATGIPPLLQEADNLYRNHRYAEARQRYEQFLQTSPPAPQGQHAWLRLAEIYGIQGDWGQAKSRYEKLLAVTTDSDMALKARYGVGQANYKLGNHLEAERILENLSASRLPGDLRFRTTALLTELSLQFGNIPQAFTRLLLLEKDVLLGEEEWFEDLKVRLLSRATSPDLEKFADLYRDTPLTPAVLLQLAKVELQAGNPEKAGAVIRTLRERFPQSPEARRAAQLAPADRPGVAQSGAVVGCLLPLSGEHADVGTQVKNGLELAASQTGVAFIVQDCGDTPQQAAALVEELASHPQVKVLVGFFPSAAAEAAATAAQRAGIPLLALTQKKNITEIGPLIFRDFFTHRLMVQALLDYTANTLGWQRFAVVYPDSRYGQALARQFSEATARKAARLVAQVSYPEGGRDVAGVVQTLTQISPGPDGVPALDAVFIPDEAAVAASVAQAIASAGLNRVRLLGTNILHFPETLLYADSLEGILFSDGFLATDPDPSVIAFVADFRHRFQQTPGYLAAQGYSSMRLLAETLKDFPGLGRTEFAQKLRHQTQPPGFSLFKVFNADREAELAIKIVTIKGKAFHLER